MVNDTKKAAPKKAAPKKATAEKAATEKAAPKKATAEKAATEKATPKKAATKPPTVKDVIAAFYRKEKLKNPSMTSDGTSLFSYGWWEMARWIKGEVILRHGRAYSRTTEIRHRRGLKGGTPATKETPWDQPAMNV